MKRLVIGAAAIILLGTIVFYASRPGDGPESEPDSMPSMGNEAGSFGEPTAPIAPSGDKKEDWFPDLSDRNDIPGVTLGINEERSTFGCDMSEISENLEQKFVGEDEDARIETYIDLLSASGDAELQIAAMHLVAAEALAGTSSGDDDSPGEVDRFAQALASDPMNPIVLWNAATACSTPGPPSFCADPNVRANMQTVLGSNGEFWLQESARLYAADDHDGALGALQRAASAPVYDSYFVEHLRMHQRALSLIPDLSPVERAIGAYGLSLTRVDNSARGLGPCYLEAADPMWFDVCVAIANRSATESPTIMQRSLGLEMLAQIYQAAGQPEEASAQRVASRQLVRSFWAEDEDMIAVLLTDERVISLYLEELEAGDEVNAVRFLSKEVERLREDPDYTPCPSADGDE